MVHISYSFNVGIFYSSTECILCHGSWKVYRMHSICIKRGGYCCTMTMRDAAEDKRCLPWITTTSSFPADTAAAQSGFSCHLESLWDLLCICSDLIHLLTILCTRSVGVCFIIWICLSGVLCAAVQKSDLWPDLGGCRILDLSKFGTPLTEVYFMYANYNKIKVIF